MARAFPPRENIFKLSDGRAETQYAHETNLPFHRWFGVGPDLFCDKDVLDLGSGFGGAAVRFSQLGARSVTGLEISVENCQAAASFAASSGVTNVRFVMGCGEQLPLADGAFDLITMYDVMEHVVSPMDVLRECHRVLRPGGTLANVFPPYYQLLGGSHLHGYMTRVPGLNLIFSTATLKSASLIRLQEEGHEYWRYFREAPTDKLWNMNGLTASRFFRVARDTGFTVEVSRHIGFRDHRVSGSSRANRLLLRPVYWMFELPAAVPILREAFCSRLVCLLRKK